ncbi:MAG: bifunctional adenosylcobinamide kinase/adenosylcobinamide-phosphate guanylyltransferase [Oscillospiraceae bacterium]
MFVLITGGSKNGKSSIAEKILTAYAVPKYYIATMEPFGEEAQAAIKRHREMRCGKGFVTVEKYTDVGEIILPQGSGALLECVGNLCANEIFSAGQEHPAEKILRDIGKLSESTEIFAAVTSQVGSDGIIYPKETMNYIGEMGLINSGLAEMADAVIEAVFGIPVVLKGELPVCL